MDLESRMKEKEIKTSLTHRGEKTLNTSTIDIDNALSIAREYAEELQLKIGAYEHALMALVNDGDRHLRLVEAYKDNPERVELHKRKAQERQEAVCIITLNRDLYIKFPQIRNASLATEAKQ